MSFDASVKTDSAESKNESSVRMYRLMPFADFEKTLANWGIRASVPYQNINPYENMPLFSTVSEMYASLPERRSSSLCSFSCIPECTSPVMWGIYAERGRGICLQFDFPGNSSEESDIVTTFGEAVDGEGKFELKEVNYTEEEYRSRKDSDESLLLNKPPCWKYEKEHRFIKKIEEASDYVDGRFYFRTPMQYLTGIILGPKCPHSPSAVKKMFELARNKRSEANLKNQQVNVSQSVLDDTKFLINVK